MAGLDGASSGLCGLGLPEGTPAREEARSRRLSPAFCLKYLTKYITYDLGPAERAGLRLFARYLGELS